MKKIFKTITSVLLMSLLMVGTLVPTAFAAATQPDQISLKSIMKESKEISRTVLKLVKDGKEDMAANLPEVKSFKEKLKENPEISKEYFSSLEAVQALGQKDFEVTLGDNESKIIEFNDGSFIVTSSSSSTNLNTAANQVILRDPIGTFSAILKTNITPGPFSVTIKHTALR